MLIPGTGNSIVQSDGVTQTSLFATTCFADEPKNSSAPESVLVETAKAALPKAGRGATENTKAKSVEELSARLQDLETRIEKLEGKAKGRKSRRKSGQASTTKTLPSSSSEAVGSTQTKEELDDKQSELRVYRLKFIDSDALVGTIRTLFVHPDSKVHFESDKRTNAIVARGAADDLATLGKLFELLDEELPNK